MESMSAKESEEKMDFSDLEKIQEEEDHPIDLFRSWYAEAGKRKVLVANACCVATTSRDCRVSARNVLLREFDNEGFVIVTDGRSKKVDQLEKVPHAAMCYLWCYENEQGHPIVRQVRIEGTMKRLARERIQHLYDREPLYCKIRSHLCDQGREVDWNKMKERHDEILNSVRRNEIDLPMPDHFVGYKLYPTMMEFYFARNQFIADRLLYRKNTPNDSWARSRIAA